MQKLTRCEHAVCVFGGGEERSGCALRSLWFGFWVSFPPISFLARLGGSVVFGQRRRSGIITKIRCGQMGKGCGGRHVSMQGVVRKSKVGTRICCFFFLSSFFPFYLVHLWEELYGSGAGFCENSCKCRVCITSGKESVWGFRRLWQTIQERQKNPDTSRSWVSRLLTKGPDKCAQKVGEEATEVCIEAAGRRTEGVVKESADLIFHLLVLWASLGIDPKAILDELARREGTSGVEEKASRPK